MIIYNVTIKIHSDIEGEWLNWMRNKHIPDVMATGQFTESRISRLLDQPQEEDPTFIVQYHCESMDKINHYIEHFAPPLRDEFNERYKGRFVLFRTLMEVM